MLYEPFACAIQLKFSILRDGSLPLEVCISFRPRKPVKLAGADLFRIRISRALSRHRRLHTLRFCTRMICLLSQPLQLIDHRQTDQAHLDHCTHRRRRWKLKRRCLRLWSQIFGFCAARGCTRLQADCSDKTIVSAMPGYHGPATGREYKLAEVSWDCRMHLFCFL